MLEVILVKKLLGWHIVSRQVVVKGTLRDTLQHAVNVMLSDERITYGTLWFERFPIPQDWEPTQIKINSQFWEVKVDRRTIVDDRVQGQYNALEQIVSKGRVFALLSNGYVANLVIKTAKEYVFLAKADAELQAGVVAEIEAAKAMSQEIEA